MEPMTALLVSSLIGSIGGMVKTGVGASQSVKGNKMLNKWEGKRPTQEVPESVNKMVELFQGLSQRNRLPGQDIYEGNIRGSTATGVEGIKDLQSGAGGLGAVTQMVAGQQDKFSQLQAGIEEMISQNQGRYASALGQKGQYEMDAWKWNQKGKWQEKMAEANAIKGAGTQNLFGGIEDITQGVGDAVMGSAMIGGGGGGTGGEGGMDMDALMKMLQAQIGTEE